jgi:hypothetical protein
MTIYADGRGGTLIIERRLEGRRLRRTTGLPDTPKGRHTAGLWDKMLDTLIEGGRSELVRALADPKSGLSFTDVWSHYRTGAWNRIPSAEHMKPLYVAVAAWLPAARKAGGAPFSASHRASVSRAFLALERLRPKATVADLPAVLRDYRADCEKRGIGRTFRKAKNAVQAFLRETQGKRRSFLWAECSDIADVPHERHVTAALTVTRAREIADKLSEPHRRIWWSLCITGMMPDELWGGKWKVGEGVRIGGTKTAFRRRTVPLIEAPTAPERQYKAFRVALKAVDDSLTPYVARRCYGHWLEEAGIHPTRVRIYMGHAIKDTTGLYTDHDVTPHLAPDAALLQGYIGFEAPRLEVVA